MSIYIPYYGGKFNIFPNLLSIISFIRILLYKMMVIVNDIYEKVNKIKPKEKTRQKTDKMVDVYKIELLS